jgi:2-C-methyl-D-erythritol 4-phosphate cytidylyltransferase
MLVTGQVLQNRVSVSVTVFKLALNKSCKLAAYLSEIIKQLLAYKFTIKREKMNIALIVSGGVGVRFNDTLPKQYVYLNGKRIIAYVIDTLKYSRAIDKIIVAAHKEYETLIKSEFDVEWTEAGRLRNQTIRKGLNYIKTLYPCEKLIILDAVRPLIKPELVDKYMDLLDIYQTVTTAQKITDSLGCYDMYQVDRERYYLLSSPESFHFDLIYSHFDENSRLTEVIHQLQKGTTVYLNFDYFHNLKITFPEDLLLAKFLLEQEK